MIGGKIHDEYYHHIKRKRVEREGLKGEREGKIKKKGGKKEFSRRGAKIWTLIYTPEFLYFKRNIYPWFWEKTIFQY